MNGIGKILGNLATIILSLVFISIIIFLLSSCASGAIYLWKNFMDWQEIIFSVVVITGAIGITIMVFFATIFFASILIRYGIFGSKIIFNAIIKGGIKNDGENDKKTS